MKQTVPPPQPGLAIIANCVTPYRVYLHTQIAARIPELRLHTLISHGAADFDWKIEIPSSINVTSFGAHRVTRRSRRVFAWVRWGRSGEKGGKSSGILQENNIQAVIVHGYRYPAYLRVIRHCHRVGIPLFVRNDSNIWCERELSSWRRWCKARVYRWWINRVTGIMSMGEYGDQLFTQYGANPARIYRVPYLPDIDFFARGVPDRLSGFQRQYGLRPDRRYLLYSGRLASQKRVDLLIDAFAAIASARPEWDLLIVGDGQLRDELHRRVPEHLRNRVIWTGFQELEGCVAAYHSADVFVLPSDREPWAVVVQEAMAAGLPVVASHVVGAAHEMIEDQVSGRIFPAGDLEALTQSLLDVTDGSELPRYRKALVTHWRHGERE